MTNIYRCDDQLVGQVRGSVILPITNERIEIRTVADVKYVKYRLERLQLEYPERFGMTKILNGEDQHV